jgi:hypothetical protein
MTRGILQNVGMNLSICDRKSNTQISIPSFITLGCTFLFWLIIPESSLYFSRAVATLFRIGFAVHGGVGRYLVLQHHDKEHCLREVK